MVTLLKPNSKVSSVGRKDPEFPEATASEYSTAALEESLEQALTGYQPETQGEFNEDSVATKGKAAFMSRLTSPLLAFCSLVTGPSMTERDRHRQSLRETRVRNNLSTIWYNPKPWW